MKNIILFSFFFLALLLNACKEEAQTLDLNPAAEGFNLENSDAEAIEIADKVMTAMGGRKAWDDTQYIQWTFFGRRTHTWDKHNKVVSIVVPDQKLNYRLNMTDMSGEVTRDGISYEEKDSLDFYLDQAHKMWINDSYWLVMPFKLKDSGVSLKYIGQDTTLSGAQSDILELTFAEVGVTPDNKYLVYVDKEEHLVRQWDYYTNYQDSLPRFQSAWPSYTKYGNILLSGAQIGENKITDISVSEELKSAFITK
jgi:hypothetical protein